MARRYSLAVGHVVAILLLGVALGVVASRFSEIMRVARNQAARSALAEANHACAAAFARLLMTGNERPTAFDVAVAAFGTDFEPTAMALGNRSLDVGIKGDEILFRVVAVGGSSEFTPISASWKVPHGVP